MRKTVRKLILHTGAQTGSFESWLTDLAQQGLHLKSLGRIFAGFERGEPRQTIYRADILCRGLKDEQAGAQIARHRERGWKFVANNRDYWIFSADDKGPGDELYTDPAEQAEALAAWSKRVRWHLLAEAAAVLGLAVILILLILQEAIVLKLIVDMKVLSDLIVLVYLQCTILYDFIYNLRLHRRIVDGSPVYRQGDWAAKRFINGTVRVLMIIAIGVYFALPLTAIDQRQYEPLPAGAVNLPAIRLADTEVNAELQRSDRPVLQDENEDRLNRFYFGNEIAYRWSPLAPVQYDINEIATVKKPPQEQAGGEYTPRVRTRYYRPVGSVLAERLMQDLLQKHVAGPDWRQTVQETQSGFFTKLLWTQNAGQVQVFARRGNEVVYVDYEGNAQAQQIIDLLPKALSAYSGKNESDFAFETGIFENLK